MFTPNPNLLNQSVAGGLANGSRLADLFQQRQDRKKLSQLAELFGQGNYEAVGAGLVGMGQVGQGVNVANIPYQREQQALQRDFQNAQFMDNRAFRQSEANWRRSQAERDDDWRRQMFEYQQRQDALGVVPKGYIPVDPDNPSAGVEPLPGLPQEAPVPLSPIGKIQADYARGLIDEKTRDALIAKATQAENGITVSPDGTVQIGGKAPTEGQAKANIYSTRMEASNEILDSLEQEGTNLYNAIVTGVPIAGNYLRSPEYRRYDQAKRDFVNATLRQESGAVISPAEFANAERQYFPQPGDDPETIMQKRRNRLIAMQAIRQASGPFSLQTYQDKGPRDASANGNAIRVPSAQTAGSTPQDAITISSEADLSDSMIGKYVTLNGQTFKVEAD